MKKLLAFITALGLIGAAAPSTGLFKASESFEAVGADPVEGEDVLIAVVDADTMDFIPGVKIDVYLDNYTSDTVVTESSPVVYHHGGHSGTISIKEMPAGYTYAEGYTKERAFMEDSQSAVLWLEKNGEYVPPVTETTAPATTTSSSATSAVTTTSDTIVSTTSNYVSPPPTLPAEVTLGNLTYAVGETYATVAKCSDTAVGTITIQSSVNNTPVEYIGSYAFKRSAISTIKIPDTIKGIFMYAFQECPNIASVTIPSSVKSIEKGAFQDCASLKSVFILNPDCEIDDSPYTFNDERLDGTGDKPDAHFSGTIYGYKNSTAQAYAEKYNYNFVAFDGEDSPKANVFVTISDEKKDFLLTYAPVTAYDLDADGIVSADEALYAAHEKYYEGGATGYRSDYGAYDKIIYKLWGVNYYDGDVHSDCKYVVNNSFGRYLSDEIKNDEHIYAYAISDTERYIDSFSTFVSFTVDAAVGEPITLKIQKSYLRMDGIVAFGPLEKAVITVDGKPTEYTTDKSGQATIVINEAGKHVISAVYEGYNIVPPVCIAEIRSTASERPEPTLKGDANLDNNVNIADAVLVMQAATNPDKYAVGKTEYSITLQGEVNADVDGKAGLTNKDALLIQKFKLGLISTL